MPLRGTEKRPVSLIAYILHYTERLFGFSAGTLLIGVACLSFCMSTILLVASFFVGDGALPDPLIMFLVWMFVSVFSLIFFTTGREWMQKAIQAEPVELITPPKAEQLPAQDILLRASAQPTQDQEKVLLRAASHAQDTPQEQLLRPGTHRSED